MPATVPSRCAAPNWLLKEINNAGGVGGRKIAIISGDSQGTPVEGVSATRRLIDLRQSRFHHRRRIQLGDTRHAARCRGRRRICSSMPPRPIRRSPMRLASAVSNGRSATIRPTRTAPSSSSKYAAEKRGFTKFAVLSVDSDYGRAAVEFTKKYLPGLQGSRS